MRPLTDRENRIIRFAVVGIVIYLVLFYGWRFLEKKRSDYRQLLQEAQTLRQQVQPYQAKVLVAKKMMEDFHLDPAKLKRESVVSEASAAIQKAAKSGGLQLGPIRESPSRGSSSKTLTTVQLESTGPVPAVLTFLAGLNSIGFPVVVDSVQFSADNSRPGQVKMSLTITILDFNQQKPAQPKTAARPNRSRSSAEFYFAVSRICSPQDAARLNAVAGRDAKPNGIRRYSRLEICVTPEASHA